MIRAVKKLKLWSQRKMTRNVFATVYTKRKKKLAAADSTRTTTTTTTTTTTWMSATTSSKNSSIGNTRNGEGLQCACSCSYGYGYDNTCSVHPSPSAPPLPSSWSWLPQLQPHPNPIPSQCEFKDDESAMVPVPAFAYGSTLLEAPPKAAQLDSGSVAGHGSTAATATAASARENVGGGLLGCVVELWMHVFGGCFAIRESQTPPCSSSSTPLLRNHQCHPHSA